LANVWSGSSHTAATAGARSREGGGTCNFGGASISLARPLIRRVSAEGGNFLFSGRRRRTNGDELEQLWASLRVDADPRDLTVVMEPTRNAWVVLAAWFRRRGARVLLVPPERAADLCAPSTPSPTGSTRGSWRACRCSLFNAAHHARRIDPTLAKRYHRLMTEAGKHHNSVICTIAATLLTRLVACWWSGEPYVLRDLDGTVLGVAEARAIVAERYTVPQAVREQRRTTVHLRHRDRTSRRSKGSQSAPSTDPSLLHATAGI
jgi:hypothetical protein